MYLIWFDYPIMAGSPGTGNCLEAVLQMKESVARPDFCADTNALNLPLPAVDMAA